MDEIDTLIETEYELYEKKDSYTKNKFKIPITEKQTEYLKLLQKKSSLSEKTFKEIFDKDLTIKDNINYIKKHIDITEKQLYFIQKHISLEKASKLLYRNIENYSDIKLYDMKYLIDYNPDLSFTKIIDGYKPKRETYAIYKNDFHEVGIQKSKYCKDDQMFYVTFYDMLVIDFDFNEDNKDILKIIKTRIDLFVKYNNIVKLCQKDPKFRIYKTFNGYHIFLISEPCAYNSNRLTKISKIFYSDLWYIIYSKYHGYNIRLNRKKRLGEVEWNNGKSHKFICDYGPGKYDKFCKEWIKLFEKYLIKYSDPNSFESSDTIFKCEEKKFFHTFVKNITNKELNTSFKKIKDQSFRKYIKEKYGNTFECIQILNKGINLKKPQRCYYSSDNFYVAVDINTNLHYICYKNLMMIDIDYYKTPIVKGSDRLIENIDDVLELVQEKNKEKGDTYVIYESNGGAHIFVTNRLFNHKEKESIEYMIEFGCDEYYMIFSYIRGWCVRVNRKKKDISNKALYKYVETIGSDLKYKELVDIHLQLIKKFGNYIIY